MLQLAKRIRSRDGQGRTVPGRACCRRGRSMGRTLEFIIPHYATLPGALCCGVPACSAKGRGRGLRLGDEAGEALAQVRRHEACSCTRRASSV